MWLVRAYAWVAIFIRMVPWLMEEWLWLQLAELHGNLEHLQQERFKLESSKPPPNIRYR